MPKEAKKRGRREEKKRKLQREEEEAATTAAAAAAAAVAANANANPNLEVGAEEGEAYYGDGSEERTEFYGLLTESESEYFRKADEILEADGFGDAEERSLFVANVFKEASGKELKIANSQGCSRLLEKLVLLSGSSQLKALFRSFSGHFQNLVHHRFASHVCEMLFLRSATIVTKELDAAYIATDESSHDEVFASMESLFLYVLSELTSTPSVIKSLLTDPFASHTLRVVVLILSGQPLAEFETLVQSRKKEKVSVASFEAEVGGVREVPKSFTEALQRVLGEINEALGVEEVRALAVHKIGSPTLQVLVQLEMGGSVSERKARKKRKEVQGTLLGKLTGIDDEEDNTDSDSCEAEETETVKERSFFQNLLYDSIGSHLAESIIRYAPAREFTKLYDRYFKGRMGNLSRNETAGFVVQRVLERLEKKELEDARGEILLQIPGLIGRSRVAVVKTLIECCGKKEVDADMIANAIASTYNCDSSSLIFKMLNLIPSDLAPKEPTAKEQSLHQSKLKKDPTQLHGSLLAQSMLKIPGNFHSLVSDSLTAQPPQTLVALSKHPLASHVVQACLESPHATAPSKRKLLNPLKGCFTELALHPAGSHIVDVCWAATAGLMNYKQSIAEELLGGEKELRESFLGRAVWRNWCMDKYKTRRKEWFVIAKTDVGSGGGGGGGGAHAHVDQEQPRKIKTPLELARERHALKKNGSPATGSNSKRPHERENGGAHGSKKKRMW